MLNNLTAEHRYYYDDAGRYASLVSNLRTLYYPLGVA